MASDRLVLDASYALELVLPTNATWQRDTLDLFDRATAGDTDLVIPMIFFAEVAATLSRKVRSRALGDDEAREYIDDLERVPMSLELSVDQASVLYGYARRWQCQAYDAMYLAAALQLDLPIATRDRGLVTAARAAKVPLYSP